MTVQEARVLRVAAVQMESTNERIEANLDRATPFAERAAQEGATLIVLPEFMPTGYLYTRAIWSMAEPKQGPTVEWLLESSRKLGVWLGTSFLEADGEDFYNTFVLSTPDGTEAGRVRKQTPAVYEPFFCKGEKGPHVIESEIGRIGVGICYENQLAYVPRLMHEHSVDLVLMPHSAPSPSPTPLFRRKHVDVWNTHLREVAPRLACSLGVPVVMVNKRGPWQTAVPALPFPFMRMDSIFPGFSAIVDSDGTVRRQLGDEEGVIVEDVILDPSRKVNRPPPCYGRWALEGPRAREIFRFIEAFGRLSYSLSSERRKRARQISSPASS
jgi:N-carbamoylputrescine amidase